MLCINAVCYVVCVGCGMLSCVVVCCVWFVVCCGVRVFCLVFDGVRYLLFVRLLFVVYCMLHGVCR